MDGGTRFRVDLKKAKYIESYKGHEIVKSHNRNVPKRNKNSTHPFAEVLTELYNQYRRVFEESQKIRTSYQGQWSLGGPPINAKG